MMKIIEPGGKKLHTLIAIASIAAYLALAVAGSLTRRPWCDEAWFANPAFNLITTGSMGSPVIEPSGTCVTGRKPGVVLGGINEHTYWIMPLHVLAQAGWYRIAGFSLFSLRMLSVLWGLVALASLFFIVKSLSGSHRVALLALAFIAVDYAFVSGASFGRMDMMNAALGFAAFAAYLGLRARNLKLAVAASHALAAASVFTHPNGILPFLGLIFLTLYFDRERIKLRHALLAAAPYLIFAAGWGLYILQSPSDFLAQFGANASGRWSGLLSPGSLIDEIKYRYLANFYLPSYLSGPALLRVIIPITYFGGVAAAALTPEISEHKGYRALLLLTLIYFVSMSVFEGMKSYFYLVHITPLFAAVLSVWVHRCWKNRVIPARILAAGVCGFLALQVAWAISTAAKNSYEKKYIAAVDFLKQNAGPSSLIMGSAEIGFALKFPENLTDDTTLGYTTGKQADFIVVEDIYYQQSLKGFESRQPELYGYVTSLLAERYQPVYDQGSYKIYERKDSSLNGDLDKPRIERASSRPRDEKRTETR